MYDHVHNVLKMNGDNDDVKDNTWSQKHFMLQLVRIPRKNKISLVKLCQIAYNVGQFKATLENEKHLKEEHVVYTLDVLNYFVSNDLGNVFTYIK